MSVYGEEGSVIYGFIPFGSWGKILTGTLSCFLPAPAAIFIYLSIIFSLFYFFSPSNVFFYLLMYIL